MSELEKTPDRELADALREIRAEALNLDAYSTALTTLGMSAGDMILGIEIRILNLVKKAQQATTDISTARYQDAMKGTGAMLNALVAGARLGSKVEVLPNDLDKPKT